MNAQQVETTQADQAAVSPLVKDILGADSGKAFFAALDAQAQSVEAESSAPAEGEEEKKSANSRAFLLQYLDMITGKKGYVTAGTTHDFKRMMGSVVADHQAEIDRNNRAGDKAWFNVFVAARNKMLHTKVTHFTNISKLRQVVLGSKNAELTEFFNLFMFTITKVSLVANHRTIEGVTRITLLMPMLTLIFASKPIPEDVQAILDKEEYARNLLSVYEAMTELLMPTE